MEKNRKDPALITSLCKDIARHASQLEAEAKGVEQSTDRYLKLKNLLTSHYLQGEDNFEAILKEIQTSIKDVGDVDEMGKPVVSPLNHALCMLNYFLMLSNEDQKD